MPDQRLYTPGALPPVRAGLSRRSMLLAAPALAFLPAAARRQAQPVPPAGFAPREIPARSLPVPGGVSPDLQRHIAAPYARGWNVIPRDAAAWKQLASESSAGAAPSIAAIKQRLGVQVQPARLGDAGVFISTPDSMPEANRARVLLHLHGGGYVLFPGEAGAGEGMLMAGYGRFRVVSVDYRMPPDFPFPAALDDAVAVWRALLGQTDPRRMAVFGSSAGGGLTLALMLRLKQLGLPLPAAIAPGTPWADLTFGGDSIAANEFVDNVLVSRSGWVGAAAPLYAAGHDLADPLISPVFGDFSGLPPAILTTGTRDLLLSDTVRVHRKLRRAGVPATLQVFEGMSHAQFLSPFVPETAEVSAEIARFLDGELAA